MQVLLRLLGGLSLAAASHIRIPGLYIPVSMTLDAATGTVFIAQLKGKILRGSLNSSATTLVKDLGAQIFSQGWHGLTSVALQGGYLYATFTRGTGPAQACADNGTQASQRPAASVVGCPTRGALVRWAYDAASGALAADPPADLLPPTFACSQFLSNGIGQVLGHPTDSTLLYVAAGVGADDEPGAGTDFGQLGGGPCTVGSASVGGNFNALNPLAHAGKVFTLRMSAAGVSPPTATLAVLAAGFHNPWRMTFGEDNKLFAVDMGGAGETVNELNGPLLPGSSFGWPCFLGAAPVPQFQTLPSSPCVTLAPQTPPFYSTPVLPPGTAGAMSAIAYVPTAGQKRFYFANYAAGTVSSFRPADSTTYVHINASAFVVQLTYVSPAVCRVLGVCDDPAAGALLAVDYYGSIREVPTTGFAPLASSGAAAASMSAAALMALALALAAPAARAH